MKHKLHSVGLIVLTCSIFGGGCKRSEPASPLPDRIELTYKILAKQDALLQAVPETYPFRSGNMMRLAFQVNVDSYAYVLARGSSGATRVLYPSEKIDGGANRLKANTEHIVPAEGWFAFDATPGAEELTVIIARRPLDEVGRSISAGRIAAQAWDTHVAPLLHRLADITKDIHYVPDTPQPVANAPLNRASCLASAKNDILMHRITLNHH